MRSKALILALAIALCAGGLSAQDPYLDLGGADSAGDGWATRRTEVTVVMDGIGQGDHDGGRLAFLLDVANQGTTDLTDLFRPSSVSDTGSSGWTYRAADLPLPVGEHTLTVYRVDADGGWTELAALPLRVKSDRGFTERTGTFTADLDAHGTSTEDETTDEFGGVSETLKETSDEFDADLQLGASVRLARPGGGLDAEIQIVGASDEERALQAGLEESPDQLDLASYLVRYGFGENGAGDASGSVELGHVLYGASRHLVDGFSSRGLNASLSFGDRIDVSAAILNGSQIVGWANPFGLDRSTHRVVAGGLGVELVPQRPGALRVDLTYLDGSVEPIADFNQGEINDAEESDGWSVEVNAASPSDRVRFTGGYARSNFTNPEDPFLSQGDDLVAVREEERDARFAEVDLELVQGASVGHRDLDLSLSASHSRVDPLYRSVAAYVQSDLEQNRAQFDLIWGGSSAQAFHVRSEDNLDDVPSILKTKTRISGFQLAVPFSDFASEPSSAMPTLSVGLQRTSQEGEDLPENGGFSAGHVPNQVSETFTTGLDWAGATAAGTGWQAGLRYESTDQDNRQPGRQDDDFETQVTSAFVSWSVGFSLDLGAELSRERFENLKLAEIDVTDRIGVNAAWRITERMSWTSNLSWTESDLRPSRGSSDSLVFDTEWSWRFLDRSWGGAGQHGASAQLYLRYSSDDTDVVDRIFGFDQQLRRQVFVTGITLSLY